MPSILVGPEGLDYFGRVESGLLKSGSLLMPYPTPSDSTPTDNVVWDGGGADDNWQTPLNWTAPDIQPQPDDVLHFAGSTRLAPVNNYPVDTPFGIKFDAGASAFTLSGNRFVLKGGIKNNTAGVAQNVNNNIKVNDVQTVGSDLGTGASGNLVLNGIISGAGGISVYSPDIYHTVRLTGVNTFTGKARVDRCNLEFTTIADAGVPCNLGAGTEIEVYNTTPDSWLVYKGVSVAFNRKITSINAGNANGAFSFLAGVTLTVNGIVDGTAGLHFVGADPATSIVILNGANTVDHIGAESNCLVRLPTLADAGTPCAAGIGSTIEITNSTATLEYTGPTSSTNKIIYGAGNLLVNTSGALTLTGADTYTGRTTVSTGTLNLSVNRSAARGAITVAGAAAVVGISGGTHNLAGNAFTVGNSANGVVNQSGGAVSFSSGDQLLIGNGASGIGTYNMSGGTLTLASVSNRGIMLGVNTGTTGIFNLSGTAVITGTSNARLQIGRQDFDADNCTATFDQTGGSISVPNFSMGGNGATSSGCIATLNIYAGTFSITSSFSHLAAGNTNTCVINISGTADVTFPAFPTTRGTSSTATLNMNGGTLRSAAASTAWMDSLTNAFIKAGGVTFNIASGRDVVIGQILKTDPVSLNGGLTKDGVGKLTLTATATYTGATTISAGTLQLGNNGTTGALSTSSAIVNDGTLAIRRTNTVTQGTDFASVISGTGGILHNPSANYLLTLNGVNTFGGGVSMTAGSLVVSTSNSALGTGTLTIGTAVTRVTVNDGLTIANNIIFNTGAGSGANGRGVLENSGAGNATVNGTITVNGAIANGGHFASVSTGTLTLAGAITSSSFTISQRLGIVIYSGGGSYANIQITGTARLGATNGMATDATATLGVSGTGNLDLNGYNQSLVGIVKSTNAAIVGNSSTATDSALTLTGTPTWAGVIQDVLGSGTRKVNVTINSSGVVIFTGTNTYTGVTTISAGTLQLGSNGTTGTILNCPSIVNNSALIFHTSNDQLYSSTIISGSGTVTKRGATSAVTLYGVNTYTGATYVEEGTLQIGNTLVDGSINNSASISVSSGGVLTFSPISSGGTYPNVISGNGQVFKAGAGTMIFTGNNTYTGLTTVIAGTLQVGNNTSTGAIAGNIKVDAALIVYRSNLYDYAGVLSSSGTIEKKGTSWLRLIGGASTFNGTITVTAGQLHFGNGSGNNGTMVDCTIVNNSAVHFSLADVTVTHNGNISGTGSLTKSGNSSTVVLAGTCTYAGTTFVNAGVLRLTGSISNSNVAVLGLATLEGPTTTGASATISNQVQVQNTGTIRPGAFGNNTLNVGPLYFDAGAIMIADSTTTTFSKIAATGDVTFGGGSIDFPAGITTDGTYKLITATGTMSGTLPTVGTNSTGKTLTLQQTGNDLEVVVS